jgi:predicted metalloprotease with PDZ domain
VRGGGRPIDFDRYLRLIGLRARVAWGPAMWNGEPERDLRIFGWEPPGEGGVRLVVSDAESIWGRAGLHTGDRLVALDGVAVTTWPELRARLVRLGMGDTIRVAVRRDAGPFETTVTIAGFQRPRVRIEEVPGATEAQPAAR